MTQAGRDQTGREHAGRDHRQRAVLCTCAGIFVVSLLAGLLGRATRGTLVVASAAGDVHATTTSQPRGHPSSDGRIPRRRRLAPGLAAGGRPGTARLAAARGPACGMGLRRDTARDRPASRPGPRPSLGVSA